MGQAESAERIVCASTPIFGVEPSTLHENSCVAQKFFVLERGTQTLGYAWACIRHKSDEQYGDRQAWIELVSVDHTGHGYGRRLAEAALRWLREQSHQFDRQNVYVGACRTTEEFWGKIGFRRLVDETAGPELLYTHRGDDQLAILISAYGTILGYDSRRKRHYTYDELLDHGDCGMLMGLPLGDDFDREAPLPGARAASRCRPNMIDPKGRMKKKVA
jgi:GNAT superfamily N-acetyltransferase